jgi:hypothetical protein
MKLVDEFYEEIEGVLNKFAKMNNDKEEFSLIEVLGALDLLQRRVVESSDASAEEDNDKPWL